MAKQNKDRSEKPASKAGGLQGAVKSAVDTVTAAVGGAAAQVAKGGQKQDPHSGGHKPAKAHGQPAKVDTSLPASRTELLDRHAAARQKRNAAPLGSDEHRAAVDEIGRIEIRIAAIERAMTPPKG
jgi:hypothetical protein